MRASGFPLGAAVHIRIFKRESLLELWMEAADARFRLFRSYAICAWSGGLGPKLMEGDGQSPEGFYRVTSRQLNPRSRYRLAFNLGFPNAYDQALGRSGSAIMVHGGCSSVGCFAMGDDQIDEIYGLVEAALEGGQPAVDIAVFPFRLTETALQGEIGSPWIEFWSNLRLGADSFERTGRPVEVATRDGHYVFGADASASGAVPISGWM